MDKTLPPISDELVPPFLELLQLVRTICDGDLDKGIILLAIVERTVRHPAYRETTVAQRLEGEVPVFPNIGVNARSIAESSGIPRESVRRKVAEMVTDGWITQAGRNLHFTAEAYRAFTPARNAIVQLAIQISGVVERRRSASE